MIAIGRMLIMTASALVLALPALAEDFWFAHANDTHIEDAEGAAIVGRAAAMIRDDPLIAFSVWLGDVTAYGTPDEIELARQTFAITGKPWHVVRGNHDRRPQGDGREWPGQENTWEELFGPLDYVFEHEGWVFIMMDTSAYLDVIFEEPRMEWLRQQLAAIPPEKPIVLCTHMPLIMRDFVPANGTAETLALFKGHNLRAVLTGHLHTQDNLTVDGILHMRAGALITFRGNRTPRGGYWRYHCKDGQITPEYFPVTAG